MQYPKKQNPPCIYVLNISRREKTNLVGKGNHSI